MKYLSFSIYAYSRNNSSSIISTMHSSNIPDQTQENNIRMEGRSLTRCDLFRFMRITMYTAAMMPFEFTSQQKLPLFVRSVLKIMGFTLEIFLYFVTMHIFMLYVYTLVLNWKHDDLEFLVSCLIQAVIYFWTVAMKIYFRRIQPVRLTRLINYLNEGYKTHSIYGFTYVTMNESLAFSNKCCKIYVYCCFVGTIFWLILPIMNDDRTLPLACWYPFDYKQPFIYEAMYALQAIGQLEVAAAFSASSGLHMALSIIISGQYDILYCSLKNLHAIAYIRAGANRDTLKEMQQIQQNADAEVDQYYCSKEHITNIIHSHTLPDYSPGKKLLPFNDGHSQLVHLKIVFRKCVYHHRYIIGALEQMENFYNPIWFFKTGEVIFLMCLVAFVSVKSTTASSSFLKIVSLAQYLILVAWEMLIICYFSEIILSNSRRCGDAVLRSPWYLHMREMRLELLFFIMKSQRVFRLTAGKIYVLNVDRFRGIMTTAFSFLTLLQKLDNRP